MGGMVQAVMPAMGSNGEQWGAADEASLARSPARRSPPAVQASS